MRRSTRRKLALGAAAALTYSGSARFWRRVRHGRGDHRVHVLAYHDVSAGREHEGVISAQRFRRHLRYVKGHFAVVPMSEAVAVLADGKPLEHDYAVVTLDDGYAGNYEHAFPILVDEQVPATVFVSTGFLDGTPLWFDLARSRLAAARRSQSLPRDLIELLERTFGSWPPSNGVEDPAETLKRISARERDTLLERLAERCSAAATLRALEWDHVRAMARAGIEIGCHTVSHPILSTLGREEQRNEITRARDRILRETGRSPQFFAYPNGSARDFTRVTMRILEESGFRAACTTIRGPNRPGCNLFALRRIGIGADPGFMLEARLSGLFDAALRRRIGLPRTPAPRHLEAAA